MPSFTDNPAERFTMSDLVRWQIFAINNWILIISLMMFVFGRMEFGTAWDPFIKSHRCSFWIVLIFFFIFFGFRCIFFGLSLPDSCSPSLVTSYLVTYWIALYWNLFWTQKTRVILVRSLFLPSFFHCFGGYRSGKSKLISIQLRRCSAFEWNTAVNYRKGDNSTKK